MNKKALFSGIETDEGLISFATNPEVSESLLCLLVQCDREVPAEKAFKVWCRRFNPPISVLKLMLAEKLCFKVRCEIEKAIISHPQSSDEDLAFVATFSSQDFLVRSVLEILQKRSPKAQLFYGIFLERYKDRTNPRSDMSLELIGEIISSYYEATEEMLLFMISCNLGNFSVSALATYCSRYNPTTDILWELLKGLHRHYNGTRFPDVYFDIYRALVNHPRVSSEELLLIFRSNVRSSGGGRDNVSEVAWNILKKRPQQLAGLWNLFETYSNTGERELKQEIALAVISHKDVSQEQLFQILTRNNAEEKVRLEVWHVLKERFYNSTEQLCHLLSKPISSCMVDEICAMVAARQDASAKNLLMIAQRAHDENLIKQVLQKWKEKAEPTVDELVEHFLKSDRKVIKDWLQKNLES